MNVSLFTVRHVFVEFVEGMESGIRNPESGCWLRGGVGGQFPRKCLPFKRNDSEPALWKGEEK